MKSRLNQSNTRFALPLLRWAIPEMVGGLCALALVTRGAAALGSHPPRCHGPHFSSRSTASHPPRIKPYSLSASTAYRLQVGLNRHVGNRIGEMAWRYSSMRKITPRTAAEPL